MRKIPRYRISDLNPGQKFMYWKGRKTYIFHGIRNGLHVYHDESGIEYSIDLELIKWTKPVRIL